MSVTRSEAIKNFLREKARSDLAALYSIDMEVQVNVAQDGGDRVEGDYKGKMWQGWTDGVTTWKPFRIPYKANSSPEYTDVKMSFDLATHAEGIGMTGWDWKNLCSRWVAFDFDAILGHSDKHRSTLTSEELEKIQSVATEIDWITVRKSTSGRGLHLYVFLDPVVPTENHTEHAALARAILGTLSAITGFNFDSKVDNCGGNMWVWHRKMVGTDGLTLIKQGTKLANVPAGWRDHVAVVTNKRRKTLPQNIGETSTGKTIDELAGQQPKITLDDEHKRLINFLKDSNSFWWWDQDHHMLVTHTKILESAHESLCLKGFFKTNSRGSNTNEQNCFAFPLRHGVWSVRRYTPGVQEHESWSQDGSGWTRSYLNKEPDLNSAARAFNGLEDPSGGFVFRETEVAVKALQTMGIIANVDTAYLGREAIVKTHKDGRVVLSVEKKETDTAESMKGWLPKKGKWVKLFQMPITDPLEPEVGNYDDIVRHLITHQHEDHGWVIKSDEVWQDEPLTHVRVALGSMGLDGKEITAVLGNAILKSWKLVNKPFQPEYPGDREWNRGAAQFKFVPTLDDDLQYPTWLKILHHCGKGLDRAVKNHPWCRANNILTGADYLKCWVASLFKEPLEPLPYLFFYSVEQNTGKSIFHEALSLLVTSGYKRADAAITSTGSFNAELEGALICVIEETDLNKDKTAYNRIKDWVTSKDILIHRKGETPYHSPNTTHWIQCANDHMAVPMFAGDTRITVCHVEPLDPLEMIPKKKLLPMLEKEAPHFLAAVLRLEIPESPDRLNIPVVATQDKELIQKINQNALERFLEEVCEPVSGQMVKFSEFYDRFIAWIDNNEAQYWSKIRVGRELPPQYPKARIPLDGQFWVGNIWWKNQPAPSSKPKLIISEKGMLVHDNS
jgi:hypothetical protein